MSGLFRKEVHQDHLVLRNTNTARRNALSPEYYDGLLDGLAEAAKTPEITAVVLAGEGDYFCSGGDLNLLKERRNMTLEERKAAIGKLHDLIRAIRSCPKPVICAVEGGAAGAGLSIALACDMVVSAKRATFTLAYVKAGLVPDGGVTHALMNALPRGTVSKMALLGTPLTAERLYDLGVLTELADPGGVLSAAQALVAKVAAGPENAIAAIKGLLTSAETAPLDVQLDAERDAMAEALGGEEARRGIAAILNKTRPVFRD
ncbi:oxepin-CoA hydrolase, alternative type [Roseibium alexandrii]|uniref:oxepin-CoA hydrolase, alternative type n=1 Tax=Roseibium alexandrii TaxID=388408 RepID=UPI0037538DF3